MLEQFSGWRSKSVFLVSLFLGEGGGVGAYILLSGNRCMCIHLRRLRLFCFFYIPDVQCGKAFRPVVKGIYRESSVMITESYMATFSGLIRPLQTCRLFVPSNKVPRVCIQMLNARFQPLNCNML